MPIFQDNRQLIRRLKWLQVSVCLFFLVLLGKLWHLSIVQYDSYRRLAERNQVRTLPLNAPRGLIYDREGRVLVDNIQGVNLVVYKDQIADPARTIGFLVSGLQMDAEALRERLHEAEAYAAYHPVVLRENLTLDEIAYILSHQSEHPELGIAKQPKRSYRYGSLAAHVMGYVGEVSRDQLEQAEFAGLKPGDIVGKFGLERTYNRWLMGVDGYRRVQVNSQGKIVQEMETVPAQEGKGLRLTIDLDLQQVAESALGDDPGAVLAFDPRSGEVLVMASSPTFDPNEFAGRISRQSWQKLVQNPDNPLRNRAIQAAFSPGSIFKVIMALAGLERGLIDAHTSVYCPGGVTLYGHYFRCWKLGGHGRVTLQSSIRDSCNVFFYLLGQRLGINQIAGFSQSVGLGRPTGVDLFGEVAGLVPSESWKRRVTGQRWHAGETISVAIGQGAMNVTPIQLGRAIGVIAGGRASDLTLVQRSVDSPRVLQTLSGSESPFSESPFSERHLDLVREGMWMAVNEWGTARGARVEGFDVCGKTGTAQTIGAEAKAKLSKAQAQAYEPNAWFAGFAPRHRPEIVVAVIVQRGGSGGARAAPIAAKVFERYHEKRRTRFPVELEVALGGHQKDTGG